MTTRFASLVAAGLLLAPGTTHIPSPAPASMSDTTAWHTLYEAVREAQPDPNRGAAVQGLVLERDVGTFELNTGALHLLQPIEGRTLGAVFVGEGRFTMTAPIPVEKAQLKKFYGEENLAMDIRSAVFFFTDDTESVLSELVTWEAVPVPSNARREIEEALDYVSDDDGWIHRDLMIPFVNATPGFFHAHTAESRGRPAIFTINPYDFEEVSLSQRAEGRGKRRETVAQFHKMSDYTTGTSVPQAGLDLLRVSHYDIESTIASNLDYAARATASVERLYSDHRWIPFRLYSELEIDSVQWEGGTPATFHRPEESSDLWIDFSSAPADSTSLTFFYQGDLFDRYRDLWIEVRSTTAWFPVYEYWRPVKYSLTFHNPEKYTVASVGTKISETTAEDRTTTIWETSLTRQATFNIGDFEETVVDDPRIPSLRIQVDENAHSSLRGMASDANVFLMQQKDMADMVAQDLANSFAFFNEAFGPTVVQDFTATEIPYAHGEAYPGLVLLSWVTFQWTDDKGFDDMFRAHEVAHQWWGIGVQPATYHDRWLSEGFSEFAGLWYTGRVRGSVELFTRRLKETREAIIDRRDEAAPIWLGTRVGTSEHPEDYQTIVYHKGAWVLHMLRTLFVDADDGADNLFQALMNDFYTTYYGQLASTEQFKAIVEKHAGMDMGWFFDQWVYGSAIPTYRFSYKLDELESGEYKATVRVRQEDVPDDFQMIVPIALDFGDAGSARVRITVSGPLTEVELPLLPIEPENIEFNPLEAVLAETHTEGWRND